jgi:hypothetical protein
MSEERRENRRAILPGTRATFEGANGRREQVDVGNLSPVGLFLCTESPLPMGKRLSLEIQAMGQAAPWAALGRVAWVRWLADDAGPAGMGVKLIDIEDEVAATIGQLVERLNPPVPGAIPDAPASRPRVPGAGTLPPATGWAEPMPPQVLERQVRERAELGAQNVAIDLVMKKPAASQPKLRTVVEDQPWDDEEMPLPRRRWGRWLLVLLLIAGMAGGGYVYRAQLRVQWSRLHRFVGALP